MCTHSWNFDGSKGDFGLVAKVPFHRKCAKIRLVEKTFCLRLTCLESILSVTDHRSQQMRRKQWELQECLTILKIHRAADHFICGKTDGNHACVVGHHVEWCAAFSSWMRTELFLKNIPMSRGIISPAMCLVQERSHSFSFANWNCDFVQTNLFQCSGFFLLLRALKWLNPLDDQTRQRVANPLNVRGNLKRWTISWLQGLTISFELIFNKAENRNMSQRLGLVRVLL